MAETKYDKVVKLAKALSDIEKLRLRNLLDVWLAPPGPPPTEEEVAQELLREGTLDQVADRRRATRREIEQFESYKPIKVKGKPISETVIEDRG
jgi:hypothetical protein